MLDSEKLELAIYRYVKSAGVTRSVTISDFVNAPGSSGDYMLIVRRFKDLTNANIFNEESEVLKDFRERLKNGTFKPVLE
jgi:hypothetical protein